MSYEAGWYQDPWYPNQHRWFDGETWTAEIEPVVGEPAAAKAGTAQLRSQPLLGCGPLLLTVGLLGGFGVWLLNSGTQETSTGVELTRVGFAGLGFCLLAFSIWMGNGTFSQIVNLVRGHGSLADVFFAVRTPIWALMSIGSAIGAAIAFGLAILGGP